MLNGLYLLFAGANYYPVGGWDDFIGPFLTLDEAKAKAVEVQADWWQIVRDYKMIAQHEGARPITMIRGEGTSTR